MEATEIVELEELRRITQYKQAACVADCLKKQGIRVFWGRKGPWTTLSLINAAGGITAQDDNNNALPGFEDENG